jgi:hypothetical protein
VAPPAGVSSARRSLSCLLRGSLYGERAPRAGTAQKCRARTTGSQGRGGFEVRTWEYHTVTYRRTSGILHRLLARGLSAVPARTAFQSLASTADRTPRFGAAARLSRHRDGGLCRCGRYSFLARRRWADCRDERAAGDVDPALHDREAVVSVEGVHASSEGVAFGERHELAAL